MKDRFQARYSLKVLSLIFALSIAQLRGVGGSLLKGVDSSLLDRVEDSGGIFTVNGLPQDALTIFTDHGINMVRLKLWNNPAEGYNNLSHVLSMARRARDQGLGLLLDFHYSDTWADPAHQVKPAAWTDLDFSSLTDSLYQFTLAAVNALRDQNTSPAIVQIGNEISCGMLWDDGRVCGSYNTDIQWDQLGILVDTAIQAVRDSTPSRDSTRICIHFDNGGNYGAAEWFFDRLIPRISDFEIIGLSYYPWWHGTLEEVSTSMNALHELYSKEILIVETAYPWTLEWSDGTDNIVGSENQLLEGFPATVEGQWNFLDQLIGEVSSIPDGAGAGLFYWAPDWISTGVYESPWENLTLFDFDGELLESVTAFEDGLTGDINGDGQIDITDVILIVDCILNFSGVCPGYDLNQDNVVTILDIVLLVDLIL
ncbi:MAG: antitoxin [FCB group bacterium]|nr:antitoxin [FCB group bacterium]